MGFLRTEPSTPARHGVFIKLVLFYAGLLSLFSVIQTGRHLSTISSPEVEAQILRAASTASLPNSGWDPLNPLAIPVGQAKNLPSVRVEEKKVDEKRQIYGGQGDKKHLGGFTKLDPHGISPDVWSYMVRELGVHSLLDVGCGRGTSTSWFDLHGVETLCVEGSHDAVEKSMLPDPSKQIVEHDFSRGPWWPEKTYDAAWAVEFLEHVNLQYQFNYVTAFRKAALLFVTSSRNGGWHHVEVHMDDWWIRKYESYGFRYSPELTKQVRAVASQERADGKLLPNGEARNAQHVWLTMKVFINPAVAALPQHAHLFPELGCYKGRNDKGIEHRECGTGKNGNLETPLAAGFRPLELTPEMDSAWEELVKKNI